MMQCRLRNATACRRVAAAAAAVTLLAVSGCGAMADVLTGRDEGPEVAKVVVLVPDDGLYSATGDKVLAAVNLALADIDTGDWQVDVERVADRTGSGTDDPVRDVVAEIASDGDVIAVVGGLTPEVIRSAQRPFDERDITFISPADDDPANTRGADPVAPQRPYDSYFRTAIPHGDRVGAAADVAVNGFGAATVIAVHDGEPLQASRFARLATGLGAEAQSEPVAGLADAVADVDGDEPVAFYLVGDGLATDVVEVAGASGLQSVVIGGESFASAVPPAGHPGGFVAIVPATLTEPPNASVPGLAGAGSVAVAAYDAGVVLAQMLERCLPPAQGSASDARHGCLSEMDMVAVNSATGHVSFDKYGDRPGSWPSVLVTNGDGWVDVARR